ncbi:MAG TPA: ANTAR domain-containing protein [Streptosporangiaceae bacterium]|nr:ANTAR domain-containing protein [Streptosporangiaceae bacterium]
MANPDLAREAADLLTIADKSRSRSLGELAALAARRVPACSGATATLWRDGEPFIMAATHPDISSLTEVELRYGRGPETAALATGEAAHCPDTLAEERWPEYARAALSRGVRCSVTLAHQPGAEAITLSLFGARPRVLDPGQVPLAELLVAAGGALVDNLSQFGDARRAAIQFRDAAQSRALVDQAKGILMNALGCSADEALGRMRQISQQGNMKVTEVASRIIDSGQSGLG